MRRRDPAALYGARMAPWLRSARGAHVAAPEPAIELLYTQARRGERTRRSAESLAAKIRTLTHGRDLLEAHDYRRRVRALRDAGITLDLTGETGPHTIDLHQPLAALIAAWAADPPAALHQRPALPPAHDHAPPPKPPNDQAPAADPDEQHRAQANSPAPTARQTIQPATLEEEQAFTRLLDKFPDLAMAPA